MTPWSVLRNPPFARLALAASASRIGDVVAALGFLFATYRITGSPGLTTGVAVAEVLPYLLFGLVGGAVADLLPRVRIMVTADVARAVVQLVVLGLFLLGAATYPAILVAVFVLQLGGCFFTPCSRSTVVDVVGAEGRVAANSVLSTIDNVALIVGPMLATLLLTSAPLPTFFALDAVTFVLSALALASMSRRMPASGPGERSFTLGAAGEAVARIPARMRLFFTELRRRPALIMLFVSTLVAILCSTWAWRVGFLLTQVPTPTSDPTFYAAMLAVFSVTGVAVSLALPLVFARFTLAHYWAAVIVWAAGLVCLGTLGSVGAAGAVLGVVLLGVGIGTASQARMFVLQHELPPGVMGQGFSAAAVLLYAGDTVSLLVFGAVVGVVAASTLITLAGALLLVSVLVLALAARLRRGPREESRVDDVVSSRP